MVDASIDEIEWWLAAVHEAAHGVCYWHYGHEFGEIRLFENADGTAGGSVRALAGRYHPMTKAVTSLAGVAAEEKVTGRPWLELIETVGANDLAMARRRKPSAPGRPAGVAQLRVEHAQLAARHSAHAS